MSTKKVWFITGASKGLGLSLVKKLLQEGHQVAATSRTAEALTAAVGTTSPDFLPLQVDLLSESNIATAVQQTITIFGRVDVVVNNAGYGIGGTLEELENSEIMQSFEVNVFATMNVIRAIVPQLRSQRSGYIINIASIAGFSAASGWAVYAATKFAVVGLSEVLAEDLAEFGIHVTVVEPGAFRTNFLTPDSLSLPANPIPDYTTVRASHARYLTMDGTQAGNPDKAASVFIQLANLKQPPVRLFLGSDAYKRATQKVALIQQGLEEWKTTSESTDF